MTNLNIREARIEDMLHIMRLISQPDMSPDNKLSEEKVKELYQQISNTSNHRLFVGLHEKEIIGTFALITIQQLSHNAALSMVVEDIVVDSKYQGSGFGKQIMRFASDEAERQGCYKLILSSGNARTNAHAFYESLGYRQDGVRFALNV